MHRLILFICGLFIFPMFSYGAELNAGFVQGLWYGSETLIAGEPTRIYVALRNNTDKDLSGTVRFTDNGTRIGTAYVSALPGRLVEAWIDWTPTYGEHAIRASLSDVRVHTIGETPTAGDVDDTLAEDTIFADYDTDGDGTPNAVDTDDDNDTVSDTDEVARGTDPLTANPIEKKETTRETEKEEGEAVREDNEAPENNSRTPVGLETYIPNQTVKTALESVTDRINETKTSLDTYRDSRADSIRAYFGQSTSSQTETTPSTSTLATITRTQLDTKETFFESVIQGGKALVSGFYTFALWIISHTLAYPAIIELIVLLFIMYMIYRTARRFGRRRNTL